MTWDGDIPPATIEQVREGKNGKVHVITEDAGGVAAGLRQVNPNLFLRYSEAGNYYVVYHRNPDTKQDELVKTYQECDGRIVEDVARIRKENETPGYSLADELERKESEAEKAREDAFSEQIGDAAERLHHALRQDTKTTNRAFIPGKE